MSAPDTAGVAVRPPVLYLGTLLLGGLIDLVFPAQIPAFAERLPTAGLALVAGLGLLVACFLRFKAAGTNVPTWMPTTALVISGPYHFSRNPIYLALTIIYLGLALAYGSWWPIVLLAPVLIVMRFGVIGREERYLEAKFGDAYRAYRASVRRWI